MLTKVDKKDKNFFNTQGKSKPVSYSLVYMVGTSKEIIMAEQPFALCKWKKQSIRHYMQYRTGNLNIIPNYGKDN